MLNLAYSLAMRDRELIWVGSALEDLKTFPEEVKDVMGYALHLAQQGSIHPDARPLKGYAGASVLELPVPHDTDTFRVMYTVKLKTAIYVLHAFQKKSKQGIATPPREVQLIRRRLKYAQELDAQRHEGGGR